MMPRFLKSVCFALLLISLLACSASEIEPLGEPHSAEYVEQGRLLVKGLAACGFCHGEKAHPDSPLSGGRKSYDFYGEVNAANLTPAKSGIAGWSTMDIVRAIRASIAPDGSELSFDSHRGFEWLSDEDSLSIVAYLRSIPAVDNTVERRDVGAIQRNTKGLLESRGEVSGYVPGMDPKYPAQYGEYLVDHVARCIRCHNSPAGIIDAEQYLVGGRTITTEAGEKIAPGITSSKTYGIGEWTEDDIVAYLKTGITPRKDRSDPEFCPTGFYSRAPERDLRAIATYLKTVPSPE
jgi:mono/diheme cytochrome c family protein